MGSYSGPWCIWAIMLVCHITSSYAITNNPQGMFASQTSSITYPNHIDHPKNIHEKRHDSSLSESLAQSETSANLPSSSQSDERPINAGPKEVESRDFSPTDLLTSRTKNAQRNNVIEQLNRTKSSVFRPDSDVFIEGSGNGPMQKQPSDHRQPIRFDDTDDSEDDDNDDEDYDYKDSTDNGSGSFINLSKTNKSNNANTGHMDGLMRNPDRQPVAGRENPYLPFRPPSTTSRPAEYTESPRQIIGQNYPSSKSHMFEDSSVLSSDSSKLVKDVSSKNQQHSGIQSQLENQQLDSGPNRIFSTTVRPLKHETTTVAGLEADRSIPTSPPTISTTSRPDTPGKSSSSFAIPTKPSRPMANSSEVDYDYDESTEDDESDDTSNFEDHDPISIPVQSSTTTSVRPIYPNLMLETSTTRLSTTIAPTRLPELTYRPIITTTISPPSRTTIELTTSAPQFSSNPNSTITSILKPSQIQYQVTTISPSISSYASTSSTIGFVEGVKEDYEGEDEEDEDEDEDEEEEENEEEETDQADNFVPSIPTRGPHSMTPGSANKELTDTLNPPPKWTPQVSSTNPSPGEVHKVTNSILTSTVSLIPRPVMTTVNPMMYESTEVNQWKSSPPTPNRNSPTQTMLKPINLNSASPVEQMINVPRVYDSVSHPTTPSPLSSTTYNPQVMRVASTPINLIAPPLFTSTSSPKLPVDGNTNPAIRSRTNQNVPKGINILNPFEGKSPKGDDADLTRQIYDKAIEVYDMTSKTIQSAVNSVWPPSFELTTQSIQPLMARPFLFMLVLGAAIIGLVLIMMLIVFLISYQIMPKDNVSIYSYG